MNKHASEGTPVEVRVVEYDDATLSSLLREFKREPGMSWGNPHGTKWIFGVVRGELAGVVALAPLPNGTLRFKSDVVLAKFRRQGVYALLSKRRLELADESGASKASTYAGPMSKGQYLRDGFKVMQVGKNGTAYMVKSL